MSAVTPYDRHREILSHYPSSSSSSSSSSHTSKLTDEDLLKQTYQFIREDQEIEGSADSYAEKLAIKYYNRLFKEYGIVDLSRYKLNEIGIRWRTHSEVLQGKGQFICGNRICDTMESLKTYEIPFSYKEQNKHKSALVKCAVKLFHSKLEALALEEAKQKKRKKLKHEQPPHSKRPRSNHQSHDDDDDNNNNNNNNNNGNNNNNHNQHDTSSSSSSSLLSSDNRLALLSRLNISIPSHHQTPRSPTIPSPSSSSSSSQLPPLERSTSQSPHTPIQRATSTSSSRADDETFRSLLL